ncbi:hypothetical protein HanIR_Chr13g0651311 [Helianthus annuus]|nr:hypothetical protein HanIR_Chr13g0651311 [Helianthus annuus]
MSLLSTPSKDHQTYECCKHINRLYLNYIVCYVIDFDFYGQIKLNFHKKIINTPAKIQVLMEVRFQKAVAADAATIFL